MRQCKYVRLVGDAYERGVFIVEEAGTKNEKRTYKPLQVHPSMQEALAANDMVFEGKRRVGSNYCPGVAWTI